MRLITQKIYLKKKNIYSVKKIEITFNGKKNCPKRNFGKSLENAF
jgi:hypothetical protein